MKHVIVYLSPAGTTETVANVIARRLDAHGHDAELIAVGNLASADTAAERISAIAGPIALWAGSPVYVDHALENVLRAIRCIRRTEPTFGAAFATFGGVTSGMAIHELIDAMHRAHVTPLGGIRVLARHSSLWAADDPPGNGHPNDADARIISEFVDAVLKRAESGHAVPVDPSIIDYQSERIKAEAAQKSLDMVRAHMPMPDADTGRCTKCGVCAETCPVNAITLSPFPVRSEECIFCNICIRHCPEHAYPYDHEGRLSRIRGMAEASDEEKTTRAFL